MVSISDKTVTAPLVENIKQEYHLKMMQFLPKVRDSIMSEYV